MTHQCNKYNNKGDEFLRDFEGMYANEADLWNQFLSYQDDMETMSIFYFLKSWCPELVSSSPSILAVDTPYLRSPYSNVFVDHILFMFKLFLSIMVPSVSKKIQFPFWPIMMNLAFVKA